MSRAEMRLLYKKEEFEMLKNMFAVCTILAFAAGAANAGLLAEYTFGINGLNNTGTVGAAANGTAIGAWAATPDDGSDTANAAEGTRWGSGMDVGGNGGWLTNITNQLTISLWSNINWAAGSGTNFATLAATGKPQGDAGGGFHLGRIKQEQRIVFTSPGTIGGYYGLDITSASLPTDGAWHHYSATYDGSNAIIYVDGAPIGSKGASGNVNLGTYDLLIGQDPKVWYGEGASWQLGAYCDDVRIYNAGLSDLEVLAQFQAGRSVLIPEPTTIALLGLGAFGLIRRKRA